MNRTRALILLGGAAAVAGYGLAAYPGWLAWGLGVAALLNLLAWAGIRRGPNAELAFVAAAGWLGLLQAQAAGGLYSLQRIPLDEANFYTPILILVYFGFLNFILWRHSQRAGLPLLQAAVVYTALLYLPSFETPEAGQPFLVPALLALAGAASLLLSGAELRFSRGQGRVLAALGLTTLAGAAAALASYAPGESLLWMFKWAVLVLLMVELILLNLNPREWKQTLLITLAASLLPVLILGSMKMIQVLGLFGLAGFAYRLNIVEIGRANLISRELMIAFPLLIALRGVTQNRRVRGLLAAAALLTIVIFGFTQSAGGILGAGLMLAFALWLTRRAHIAAFFTGERGGWRMLGAGLLLALLLTAGGAAALRLNVGSFNGRLFQFRASAAEIGAHPLLGVGPGVYHVKAQVAEDIRWVADSQKTLDDPLLPVQWYQDSSTLHAHNLFMEIGTGMGLPGLACFIAFIGLLFWQGISALRSLAGEERILLTGALIGVSATIAWGLLDVVQAAAPFFATSIWVLAGLVLSAGNFSETRQPTIKIHPGWLWGAAASILLILIVLLGGNWNYRQAFGAMLAQEWEKASQKLAAAGQWEPFNAKYAQLRGEMLINMDQYEEAAQAYHLADAAKREYSPYLRQLGWLERLAGNAGQAELYFNSAIKADPNAAWVNDIYSSLGLLYAASGRDADAAQLFARELSLDPSTAALPHWRKILDENGDADAALDPAYLDLENPDAETQKRILEKLGRADLTAQNFAAASPEAGALKLTQVLAVMQQRADNPATSRRDRITLLASMAAASRAAGLEARAETCARELIKQSPESGFGYLVLAQSALGRADLASAQQQIDLALERNPHNVDALALAAQVASWMGDGAHFKQYIARLTQTDPLSLQTARLQPAAEGTEKIQILAKIAALDPSITGRLELVDALLKAGKLPAARSTCHQALRDAALKNPGLLSSNIEGLGNCLAKTAPRNFENILAAQVKINPRLAGWVRVYTLRSLGDHQNALAAAQSMWAAYPQQWISAYLLGQQAQAMGDQAAAESAFLQAASLDGRQSLPWEALGSLYTAQGRIEEALAAYQSAAVIAPGRPQVWQSLAKIAFQQGKSELALEGLRNLHTVSGADTAGEYYNFYVNLTSANLQESSPGTILPDLFNLTPQPLPTIFMHPDSSAAYDLVLPHARDGEKISLRTFIGMSPESWAQEGDGVTFSIRITADGKETELYQSTIDPKHQPADRRWLPIDIDLTPWAGRPVRLVLATGIGPAGDNRYDWAGWGNPRILLTP